MLLPPVLDGPWRRVCIVSSRRVCVPDSVVLIVRLPCPLMAADVDTGAGTCLIADRHPFGVWSNANRPALSPRHSTHTRRVTPYLPPRNSTHSRRVTPYLSSRHSTHTRRVTPYLSLRHVTHTRRSMLACSYLATNSPSPTANGRCHLATDLI